MPGDEPGSRRLAHDDVDDVLAVPAPSLTQEGLLAVIVVRRVVLEDPVGATIGKLRESRLVVPASERPRGRLDVVLCVVELSVHANSHGEKLQQLPAVIFVDGVLVVFRSCPGRRPWRDPLESSIRRSRNPPSPQRRNMSISMASCLAWSTLEWPQHSTPCQEEGNLLLQRALRVDHPVAPYDLADLMILPIDEFGKGPVIKVILPVRLVLGVE